MNIVMRAVMETSSMDPAMQSDSLSLIDRICAAYESACNEDAGFAAEIMRVIRAVAVSGQVTLLAGGPAAELLRAQLSHEPLLWASVHIEDDSVPDSRRM